MPKLDGMMPKPRDSGVEFTQSLVGQNVDREYVPSVEKGVNQVCTGGIAGCRVTDVKIDFYDGKMHPVDSKDIAFQIAGYFAFEETFTAAKPCCWAPRSRRSRSAFRKHCMGKVMGDLSSRRGKILGIEAEGAFQVIKASVPTSERLPLLQHAPFADRRGRRPYRDLQPLRGNAARRGRKGDCRGGEMKSQPQAALKRLERVADAALSERARLRF